MDSKEYWKKRESENLKKNLKTEEEYAKELRKQYDYMMDQIQKEINGFYAKYASKEGITMAEAKRRVSKLDIEAYGRKAAKYVAEKNFSDQANEEMRLYNATMKINRLEMLKANIGLELVDGFNDLQQFFEDKLMERTLDEFERQAGILGKSIRNNVKNADAIVNASFNNAKYSDRIWMYQDMMKAELSKLLQEGLIQGKNPNQLARHLTKLFGVQKSNAERLMRTELARVQTEAQKQSFERNGYKEYEFIALGSACDVCRAIDGKHFRVEKMMPGEKAPPMHPNCRCSTAAYMDEKEYEEWLDFLDKGGTTEKWNWLKNASVQATDRKSVHCYGDYLRDKLGSAPKNNKTEVDDIVARVEQRGGKIIFHDSVDMIRNISRGSPGEIKVDKNISIAGLRHELRHYLDDEKNGYPGLAYYLKDNDIFFEYEKRGYEEELAIAREKGYIEIEKKILDEIEKRRKEIYGE